MRLWEFGDNKASPLNMVLEQDFILHVRRLKKLKTPHIAANIKLGEIPADYNGRGSIEEAQKRLMSFIQSQEGFFSPMSNGDVFLTWPVCPENKHLVDQSMQVTLPDGVGSKDSSKYMKLYKLPDDYTKVRRTVDNYIHAALPLARRNKPDDVMRLLQSPRARGDLTAWSVNLIESLIKKIDIHLYIRSQSIYKLSDGDKWERLYDEAFIGLDELRQEYFSHLNVSQPKHLFLELCQYLDSKILETLRENYDSIKGLPLSLNLSVTTVLGVDFANFTRAVPREDRKNFGFEIHCGDLMHDFEITLNILDTLREEGYKIALDGITPNMLEYFSFSNLHSDAIKIDVRRDYVRTLRHENVQFAIRALDPEKVIFVHCDNDESLAIGKQLGVTKFQGFTIDDLALASIKDAS